MTGPDVTVAIPLHRSARWVDVIEGNVQRIAQSARVVISDATEVDDALSQLRERLHDYDVEWLGPRDLAPGYVPHYNDLLARTTTPFFMWLPADDEIDADYVRLCTNAVRADEGVIMAVGQVVSVPGAGMCEPAFPPMPAAGGSASGIARVTTLTLDWEPWILFRSVFRRACLHPVRDTDAGAAADALWITGLLGRGRATQVEQAVYRKRFYGDSAHVSMRQLSGLERAGYAYRELRPSVGRSGAARVLAAVGATRITRHVSRRGYLQSRAPAPCGHTFCAGTDGSDLHASRARA